MDKVNSEKRSQIMSNIKSKDSQMELMLRRRLAREGYRYRKNVSYLPGKPDIAFIAKQTAIFLDSCFWHGCSRHCRMPKTNVEYWKEKIKRNKKRDKEINKKYKEMHWKVLRFWEHDIKKDPRKIIKKIATELIQ